MKVVFGILICVAFLFLLVYMGKRLFESILSFIDVLRWRRNKKLSEVEVKDPDQVSDTAEKEVHD